MMNDKEVLLDTNILLRAQQVTSIFHQKVSEKLYELASSGKTLCICPQNIYEFYAVATRSEASNGLGLTQNQAILEIENLLSTYVFKEENMQLFSHWKALIEKYVIQGKTTHDARLVALMLSHKIESFYTLNQDDFNRYDDIISFI